MDKSSFQFNSYKIVKSELDLTSINANPYSIEFEPSGVLSTPDNIFTLTLTIKIIQEENGFNMSFTISAEYEYNTIDDNFDFLYINAPAILFPYIRAYITSITSLSGFSPIILPTLNLIALKEKIKENITRI